MMKIRSNRGLSLIEVLVTITITSIGLMGLVSLQMQAVRATTDSGNRSQAIWIFNDIANRIHANENSSTNYVTNGVYQCAAEPVICSTYNTGTLLRPAVAECTGAQMAAWDLHEIACGSTKTNLTHGNSINYLPGAELTIACTQNPCLNGITNLAITLRWREKANKESITGRARTADSGWLTMSDEITP